MDRAALSAREHELNHQLRALTDSVLAFRIDAADSLDVLLRRVTDQSREITGAHQAVTTLVPDGDWRQSVHAISLSDKYAAWRSYDVKRDGAGIYRVVCESNRPLRLTQAELEVNPRWREFDQEAGRHPPIRGLLAAPLIGHDRRNLGLIQVSDKVDGEFTAVNEAILVQLALLTSAVVENVRLHRAAQEANRLKDDFLAALSHELRTLLSAILGWARVLRSGQSDHETTEQALESIERNVRVQTTLIDDLLDVSHIISGRLRLEVRLVELGPVVLAAVETIRRAAEAKAIRVDTALDPRAGGISGDPDRLQQIVRNLVSNAVKFTPRGGSVMVRLERRDAIAEIVVRDTGHGIAPEILPHVFDRFRQAGGSAARDRGALGLGLAVARHLTELHGGAIRAESTGLGRGATFTVSFPVWVPGDGPARVAPGQSERIHESAVGVLAGVRVLIVDDEEDVRETLRVVLGQRGAEVRTTTGGAQAFDLLARWPPDVLVSDIGMPGEDGYSLIRRIRALAPDRGGRVPAVALTAYITPEDRMEALAAGFQTHVPKPADPDELARVIGRLAGLSRPASP
jgi:signal transduction histidine kinase/CheY-like chemotaxis protein